MSIEPIMYYKTTFFSIVFSIKPNQVILWLRFNPKRYKAPSKYLQVHIYGKKFFMESTPQAEFVQLVLVRSNFDVFPFFSTNELKNFFEGLSNSRHSSTHSFAV